MIEGNPLSDDRFSCINTLNSITFLLELSCITSISCLSHRLHGFIGVGYICSLAEKD